MGIIRSTTTFGICAAILVAQVVLPATLDLLLSGVLICTSAWAGFKAGRSQ